MKNVYVILFISLLFLANTCKNAELDLPIKDQNENIKITKSQFKSEKMKLEKATLQAFVKSVSCVGMVMPKTNGSAMLSVPVGGIVEKIFVLNGKQVQKSEDLLAIGGKNVIDLQQEFAEASAKLDQLKLDYERSEKLFKENIQTEKEFIAVRSTYKSGLAKYNSLKLMILSINLDTNQVKNGSFYKTYVLKSPIEGKINNLNVNLGQYIEPQNSIIEIVDENKLQLKLSVFEKDINKIEKGQKVVFSRTDDKSNESFATITTVNNSLNNSTKTLDCYADFDNKSANSYINHSFLDCQVIVSVDSILAIPKSSLISSDEGTFILVLQEEQADGYVFEKVALETVLENKDFIQVQNNFRNYTILTDGVYNIQ